MTDAGRDRVVDARPYPGRDAEHRAGREDLGGRAQGWLAGLPLRRRVSVLAALGVGLAVALTSVAAYGTVSSQLQQQRDETLLQRARAAVSTPLGDPARLVEVPSAALGAADLRIALARADRTAFTAEGRRNAPPVGAPELAVASGESEQSVRTATVDVPDVADDAAGAEAEQFRVVAVPAASGYALVLAQSTAEVEQTLRRLGLVLLLVGGIGVALAAYAGLVIARAGLRPVERLTVAAEHVAATERLEPLAEPIAVQGDDEIARLARSFNAMLTSLAASRERQRQLVADAGHELRTPLTSLRTNLDLLAQSQQSPARDGLSVQDRAELLADVSAQVQELTDLVGDLVELAREDPPAPSTERVDIHEVVDRAVERVSRRSGDVRFAVHGGTWIVEGDAAVLERAVTNLLDNAAKWSPPGGTVTITLHAGVLEVADEGPGIAAADLPHVFDRFYRSPEARTMPGSGLGLAIVRQAAQRHGGTVTASSPDGRGTVVTMRLPHASSPALG